VHEFGRALELLAQAGDVAGLDGPVRANERLLALVQRRYVLP
jgi:hypothetical protein